MADGLLLYISAASDLRAEREVLGRAVTEVPVPLAWRAFRDPADLRRQFLALVAGHLVERAIHYRLSPLELARLEEWRTGLDAAPSSAGEEGRGAGESGVILSRERFVPSEGVLIDREKAGRRDPGAKSLKH